MRIPFTKMHGIGNDYVYVDAFKTKLDDPLSLIYQILHSTSLNGDVDGGRAHHHAVLTFLLYFQPYVCRASSTSQDLS